MKTYQVYVDVRFTGTMEIEADRPSEAKAIARHKQLVPSDIKNFYHTKTSVSDVEEV